MPRRSIRVTGCCGPSAASGWIALDLSRAFAGRVLTSKDPVDTAFRLAYSRQPDGWEKDSVATFLEKQKHLIAARPAGGKLALPTAMPEGLEPAAAAAFVDFC